MISKFQLNPLYFNCFLLTCLSFGLGFDLSVAEMFSSLCSGGTLFPIENLYDKLFLGKFIKINKIHNQKVNIAEYHLSRSNKSKYAYAIIKLDEKPTKSVIDSLNILNDVLEVKPLLLK